MSITAIIPAHMNSIRLPGKILIDIHGLPMIEHVRRRALLSKSLSEVYVATCDEEIKKTVESFGGSVIMTSNRHLNGTSRVIEAAADLNTNIVMLLQGDEPLILPDQIDHIIYEIIKNLDFDSWNATANLMEEKDLLTKSFVKCEIEKDGNIHNFFRVSNNKDNFSKQKKNIKKILGLIAYKKECLIQLKNTSPSQKELKESIEQFRIIENNFSLKSIEVDKSIPSVNEPGELDIVIKELEINKEQLNILRKIKSE